MHVALLAAVASFCNHITVTLQSATTGYNTINILYIYYVKNRWLYCCEVKTEL